MSAEAAFCPRLAVMGGNGLTRLEFVGIVYEHGETFELVFARSAAVVRADGTLAT
jgi:hypothetical protein